jgi:hypothetical protein
MGAPKKRYWWVNVHSNLLFYIIIKPELSESYWNGEWELQSRYFWVKVIQLEACQPPYPSIDHAA